MKICTFLLAKHTPLRAYNCYHHAPQFIDVSTRIGITKFANVPGRVAA